MNDSSPIPNLQSLSSAKGTVFMNHRGSILPYARGLCFSESFKPGLESQSQKFSLPRLPATPNELWDNSTASKWGQKLVEYFASSPRGILMITCFCSKFHFYWPIIIVIVIIIVVNVLLLHLIMALIAIWKALQIYLWKTLIIFYLGQIDFIYWVWTIAEIIFGIRNLEK